jgi:DNA-binding NarL/FixJ family response regulator
MAPTTVVLAAPAHGARAAMRAALDPDAARVAGEACTRWAAGERVRDTGAHVVVADVGLLSGRDFFLRGWGPVSRDTRVVAVGPDDPVLRHCLRVQGVAAYVVRDRMADELPAAVAPARAAVPRQAPSRNGG